ncbi:MAG: hypothetical protein M1814_002845 [Vezdaea aestivalis]|nr:MAG: hypothetical protein M1814_002845 [Vezdaea aestivalis]
MRSFELLYPGFLLWAFLVTKGHAASKKARDAVLLTDVNALTLYGGRKTTHRRVSALPQLKCVGGDAKGIYEIDVLRCKNQGTDYDDLKCVFRLEHVNLVSRLLTLWNSVQWTCTSSLPSEFKLGSTNVICEGYSSPDDPYILKGSCGVEYKLFLTSRGEEKYGHRRDPSETSLDRFIDKAFWFVFAGIIIAVIYALVRSRAREGGAARDGRPGQGWGGGGGGPGGDDPPPPYDGPPKPNGAFPRSYGAFGGAQNQGGWRPGFWTGALGGAAAAYAAGNRNQGNQRQDSWWGSNNNQGGRDSWQARGSNSRSSFGSSSRHESQGFGSTSRR